MISNKSEPNYLNVSNSSDSSFFCTEGVKRAKLEPLKNRLRALILAKGMREMDFFNSIGISRQHWYSISWGLQETPTHLKLKIAKALGVDSRVIWEEEDE